MGEIIGWGLVGVLALVLTISVVKDIRKVLGVRKTFKVKEGSILVLDKMKIKYGQDMDTDFEDGHPFGRLVNTGDLVYYEVKEVRNENVRF